MFNKLTSGIPDCCRLDLALEGVDRANAEFLSYQKRCPPGDARRTVHYLVGHGPTGTPDEERETLTRLPAIRDLIAQLPGGRVRRAHLASLPPGGCLPAHRDGDRRFALFNSTLRLHVPLSTHPDVWFLANGRTYRMGTGELWMLNNLVEHAVLNDSDTERTHLIVDVEPEEQLMALVRGSCTPPGGDGRDLSRRIATRYRGTPPARPPAPRSARDLLRLVRDAALNIAHDVRHRVRAAHLVRLGDRIGEDAASLHAWCLFVGYPRSGHSLVGAMLDAHRHVMIGHAISVFRQLRRGYSGRQLVAFAVDRSRRYARGGCRSQGFSYAIPGQWQGRYEQLRVVGDKRGGEAARMIQAEPQLLDELATRVGLPLKLVHVVRNPFDNIATISRRHEMAPDAAMDWYFRMANAVHRISAQHPVLTLRHEETLADPAASLRALADWLAVDCPADWLNSCARLVRPQPSRPRTKIPWDAELRDRVQRQIAEHPFLAGYGFDT